MAEAPVKAAFADLGIEWKVKEHPVAPTVEDGIAAIGEWASECSFAKNLFVKDKKAGLFLITTTADRKVDIKALPALLKLTGANFRMADGAASGDVLADSVRAVALRASPIAGAAGRCQGAATVLPGASRNASALGPRSIVPPVRAWMLLASSVAFGRWSAVPGGCRLARAAGRCSS